MPVPYGKSISENSSFVLSWFIRKYSGILLFVDAFSTTNLLSEFVTSKIHRFVFRSNARFIEILL